MRSPSSFSLSPLIKCHLFQTKPPRLTIKVRLLGNSRITISNMLTVRLESGKEKWKCTRLSVPLILVFIDFPLSVCPLQQSIVQTGDLQKIANDNYIALRQKSLRLSHRERQAAILPASPVKVFFGISEALDMNGMCQKHWLFNSPRQWKLANKNHVWKIKNDGWNGTISSLSNLNLKLNWSLGHWDRDPWPLNNYIPPSFSLLWRRSFYSWNC